MQFDLSTIRGVHTLDRLSGSRFHTDATAAVLTARISIFALEPSTLVTLKLSGCGIAQQFGLAQNHGKVLF